jgi:DNA-binding MarR family transcriptional regulator
VNEATRRKQPPASAPAGSSTRGQPDAGPEGWAWGDQDAGIPPDAPLPALISVMMRLMGAFLWSTAQEAGISAAGLAVMRLLAARDGLKSSEVAARGLWSPGTVTSVVDTLVRDGYVERRRGEADRRVVWLHLTGRGRAKVTEAVAVVGPKWDDAFAYLDPADEPVIRKFLMDTIKTFGTLVREERCK